MFTVESLTHLGTRFNQSLGVVTTTVEMKLSTGDIVTESYGFMAVRAMDITSGRLYAIVEMTGGESVGKKGVFTLHPTGSTRIAGRVENARALWSSVVPELNRWLDAQELMSIRVRAVVSTIADVESLLSK